MKTGNNYKKIISAIFPWLILSLLFLVSVGGMFVQFHSNQHLHLLRGLASGSMDGLANDWLANTSDPMPVFNVIVRIASKYLGTSSFYIIQVILIAVYLYSMLGITDHLFDIKRSKFFYMFFVVIYLFSYSVIFTRFFKIDIYAGLADQYLGFNTFLPNIFGVFLFLSLYLFLKKKHTWAVITLCIAGYIHTGYVIASAVLTASYMVINYFETKEIKTSLKIGILALILISPMVVFNLQENAGATTDQIFESTRILVEERIPHHTQVDVWWGPTAVIKLHICIFALWIFRKSQLFPLILIGFLVVFLPIPILRIRPSNVIALLQLWRAGVFLIPLCTTLILGYLITNFYSSREKFLAKNKKIIYILLGIIVVFFSVTGIKTQFDKVEYYNDIPTRQLFSYINENPAMDSNYLIPPKDYDLQGFRLETETPLFVDWKSHPWNSLELLEWYDRLNLALSFYEAESGQACSILSTLVQDYQISHLITYTESPAACPNLDLIYQDEQYLLYTVDQEQQQ
jgi:hypothetical protein